VRGFVVSVALASLIALPATAFGSAKYDWRRLHRPLHFPTVQPSNVCPTKPAAATLAGRPLNGKRPVYLMSAGDAPAATISINPAYTDSTGWVGQKTPWLIKRRYKGPLLIRAARIDSPGPVRLAKGAGQHLSELRFKPSDNNGFQGPYGFLASASLFRAQGCYAFQIDGTSFSNVIVMRVVVEAS
jgi:hypothetical protein